MRTYYRRPCLRAAIVSVLVVTLVAQASQPLWAVRPSLATDPDVAQLMGRLNPAGKAQLQQAIAAHDSKVTNLASKVTDGLLSGAVFGGIMSLGKGLGMWGLTAPALAYVLGGAIVGAVGFWLVHRLHQTLQVSRARETFARTIAMIGSDPALVAPGSGPANAAPGAPDPAGGASAVTQVTVGTAAAAHHVRGRASGAEETLFGDLPRAGH